LTPWLNVLKVNRDIWFSPAMSWMISSSTHFKNTGLANFGQSAWLVNPDLACAGG
jgi:hypothetical protein